MPIEPLDDTIVLRPRVQTAEDCLRPTRAEVDLSAVARNLRRVRETARGARVLAVVKADAYGHGMIPVAIRLQREGVDGFCVALAEEGLELREAGITSDILVLNGAYGQAHHEVLAAKLTPVVYDLGHFEAFSQASRGQPFSIHLKVDTGMARLGVCHDGLSAFLLKIQRYPTAHIEGFMTHLATAGTDEELVRIQLARFEEAIKLVRARGHAPHFLHAANSAATFRYPESRFNLVRVGIALYGYEGPAMPSIELHPALSLRSEIIALRNVPSGTKVGYDGLYCTSRPTLLATLPLGYADGLLRSAYNRGIVLVRGQRCPIVGAISMDLCTVDVTDLSQVAVGDEVLLLGTQGGASIDAQELASTCGTIAYEVLTSISRRVPRLYHE